MHVTSGHLHLASNFSFALHCQVKLLGLDHEEDKRAGCPQFLRHSFVHLRFCEMGFFRSLALGLLLGSAAALPAELVERATPACAKANVASVVKVLSVC